MSSLIARAKDALSSERRYERVRAVMVARLDDPWWLRSGVEANLLKLAVKFLRRHFGLSKREAINALGEVTILHIHGLSLKRREGQVALRLDEIGGLTYHHSGRADWFTLSCPECDTEVYESSCLDDKPGQQLAHLGRAVKKFEAHRPACQATLVLNAPV